MPPKEQRAFAKGEVVNQCLLDPGVDFRRIWSHKRDEDHFRDSRY